jgi:hypothetical protein
MLDQHERRRDVAHGVDKEAAIGHDVSLSTEVDIAARPPNHQLTNFEDHFGTAVPAGVCIAGC